ncbi:hypothetical protein Q5P01_010625 [Channa striata]|uniref:Uncharacterized protein n=1 Tax=Channa striata TaxID=64152 RepID=A0AA88MRQ3_CHASR|nr:hypothetical protein Q5P01_010625 [Channa striata]
MAALMRPQRGVATGRECDCIISDEPSKDHINVGELKPCEEVLCPGCADRDSDEGHIILSPDAFFSVRSADTAKRAERPELKSAPRVSAKLTR